MTVVRKCPLCGAAGHACGPRTTVVGLDPANASRRDRAMGPLREYNVTVNGTPTTMQLTEKDAERLGGTLVGQAAELPAPDVKVHARRATPNKARTVKDKRSG